VPRLDHNELLSFSEQLLSTGGMPQADSKLVAELLVKQSCVGIQDMGVTRIPQYLSFIQNGTIKHRENPKVLRCGKTTAVIDGNHYIGQVLLEWEWDWQLRKPKNHGVGVVSLRRASHTGRLADYMEMATEAGLIGMGAVSVGSGTTTLYGGMERIVGTNPMAFGIPARNGRHIILDFATASMSMGEIQKQVARKENHSRRRHARRARQPDKRFQSFPWSAARRLFYPLAATKVQASP